MLKNVNIPQIYLSIYKIIQIVLSMHLSNMLQFISKKIK